MLAAVITAAHGEAQDDALRKLGRGKADLAARDSYSASLPANGFLPWQQPVVDRLAVACTNRTADCEKRDLYEFGVYAGRYLRGLTLALKQRGVPFRRFWGFDSVWLARPERASPHNLASTRVLVAPVPRVSLRVCQTRRARRRGVARRNAPGCQATTARSTCWARAHDPHMPNS
jgi:hypothetical protein